MNEIRLFVNGQVITRKPIVEKSVYGIEEVYAKYQQKKYLVRNGQNFLDGMVYETYSLIGL